MFLNLSIIRLDEEMCIPMYVSQKEDFTLLGIYILFSPWSRKKFLDNIAHVCGPGKFSLSMLSNSNINIDQMELRSANIVSPRGYVVLLAD